MIVIVAFAFVVLMKGLRVDEVLRFNGFMKGFIAISSHYPLDEGFSFLFCVFFFALSLSLSLSLSLVCLLVCCLTSHQPVIALTPNRQASGRMATNLPLTVNLWYF